MTKIRYTDLDTTASAPSEDEDDDEVMEAEPQRDTGGTSPTVPSANAMQLSNINETRVGSNGNESSSIGYLQDIEQRQTPFNARETGSKDGPNKQTDVNSMSDNDWELANSKLHCLRRVLLGTLLGYLHRLRNVGKHEMILHHIKSSKLVDF